METGANGLEKYQSQRIPGKETGLLFHTQAGAVGGGQVSSPWAVAWEAFASHAAPETAVCFLIPAVQEGLTWKCLGVSNPPSPSAVFLLLW